MEGGDEGRGVRLVEAKTGVDTCLRTTDTHFEKNKEPAKRIHIVSFMNGINIFDYPKFHSTDVDAHHYKTGIYSRLYL